MKKTKIITSLGPSSYYPDIFEKMVYAGANVGRINFSHATAEEKIQDVETVKEVRRRTGYEIGILYDTKGPEFRNDLMENDSIELIEGKTIKIVKEEVLGNQERFSVNHPQAIDSLNVGNVILLENGLMKIEVIEKTDDYVNCKIINGGTLGNKKSLNAPGVKLDIPFISEADREDLIYAATHDGDYIALSFTSTKEDVLEAKALMSQYNKNIKYIAKIESTTGIENLDEIIEVSDGIMVARGDLGVEVDVAMLPIYQKMMIEKCRKAGKFVIVATEMLETMKKNMRPTRAEVSDVANAVLNGTDAVMLSGETTQGKYPIETVDYMAKICENSENFYEYGKDSTEIKNIADVIAKNVVDCTYNMDIKAIIVPINQGSTVKRISNLKPKAPIIALCHDKDVASKLTLNYGIYTMITPMLKTTDEVLEKAKEVAKSVVQLKNGDKIIIAGSFPLGKKTNMMQIEEI